MINHLATNTMTSYNTKTATDECNRIYALDTSRVPETITKETQKVQVQCLLHEGFYDVSFKKLAQRKDSHSPGCPECAHQMERHSTRYAESKGNDGSYEGQEADNFRTMVKVHRAYPDYYPNRPHGGDEYVFDYDLNEFKRV